METSLPIPLVEDDVQLTSGSPNATLSSLGNSATGIPIQAKRRHRSGGMHFKSKDDADSLPVLTKPDRTVQLEHFTSVFSGIVATVSSLQGWRKTMEDAHFISVRGGLGQRKLLMPCAAAGSSNSSSTTPRVVTAQPGGPQQQHHHHHNLTTTGCTPISSPGNVPLIPVNSIVSGSPYGSTAENLKGQVQSNDLNFTLSPDVVESLDSSVLGEDEFSRLYPEIECYVGIYDGHRNRQASDYCQAHMHYWVAKCMKEQGVFDMLADAANRQTFQGPLTTPMPEEVASAVHTAMQTAFASCDDVFRKSEQPEPTGGSTVGIAIVTATHIILAQLGDCRLGVLFNDANQSFFSAENDHRPISNEAERSRLEAINCPMTPEGRVGGLSISRAIGDFESKPIDRPIEHRAISVVPDVFVLRRPPPPPPAQQGNTFVSNNNDNDNDNDNDNNDASNSGIGINSSGSPLMMPPIHENISAVIVLGCDGVWEVHSNMMEVVEKLLRKLTTAAESEPNTTEVEVVTSFASALAIRSCASTLHLHTGASLNQAGLDNISFGCIALH